MIGSRFSIVGAPVSRCDQSAALAACEHRLKEGGGGYVCFVNVHSVVTARLEPAFKSVLDGAFLCVADGKAVYWAGRAYGASGLGHVPGPDFMLQALRSFPTHRHYLFGSSPQVLEQLVDRLRVLVPGVVIAGSYSPPFRPPTEAERVADYQRIRDARPDFVWVGLGAPKQEAWMAAASAELAPSLLFGVGAAFDFLAGSVRRAPEWMRRLGLEWFYRLMQEPRRLWRRYLVTNSLFVGYLLRDLFRSPRRRQADD